MPPQYKCGVWLGLAMEDWQQCTIKARTSASAAEEKRPFLHWKIKMHLNLDVNFNYGLFFGVRDGNYESSSNVV